MGRRHRLLQLPVGQVPGPWNGSRLRQVPLRELDCGSSIQHCVCACTNCDSGALDNVGSIASSNCGPDCDANSCSDGCADGFSFGVAVVLANSGTDSGSDLSAHAHAHAIADSVAVAGAHSLPHCCPHGEPDPGVYAGQASPLQPRRLRHVRVP